MEETTTRQSHEQDQRRGHLVDVNEYLAILAERGEAMSRQRLRLLCREGRVPGAIRDTSRPAHPWMVPADARITRPEKGILHRLKPKDETRLSVAEFAKKVGVHRQTAWEWIRNGDVQAELKEWGWAVERTAVRPKKRN